MNSYVGIRGAEGKQFPNPRPMRAGEDRVLKQYCKIWAYVEGESEECQKPRPGCVAARQEFRKPYVGVARQGAPAS